MGIATPLRMMERPGHKNKTSGKNGDGRRATALKVRRVADKTSCRASQSTPSLSQKLASSDADHRLRARSARSSLAERKRVDKGLPLPRARQHQKRKRNSEERATRQMKSARSAGLLAHTTPSVKRRTGERRLSRTQDSRLKLLHWASGPARVPCFEPYADVPLARSKGRPLMRALGRCASGGEVGLGIMNAETRRPRRQSPPRRCRGLAPRAGKPGSAQRNGSSRNSNCDFCVLFFLSEKEVCLASSPRARESTEGVSRLLLRAVAGGTFSVRVRDKFLFRFFDCRCSYHSARIRKTARWGSRSLLVQARRQTSVTDREDVAHDG